MLGRALRRRGPVVAGIVVVGVAAAAAYSVLAPERYSAEAELLVTRPADEVVRSLGIPVDPETVARLVETPAVASRVATRLGLDGRDAALDAVSAARAGDSSVVVVRAEAGDPERTAQIANAFADEALRERSARFQAAVRRETELLRAELAGVPLAQRGGRQDRLRRLRALEGERDPTVELLASAVAPSDRDWPKPIPIVVASALAALLLGGLVAVALDWEPRRAPPPPEAPAAPAPAPAPAAPRRRRRSGRYDVHELERLLAAHPQPDPEWEVYLAALRAEAGADGKLPKSLDWLVEDVYRELLGADR